MPEVEVDDTTVVDTRLPASTFVSTMRTMVISPTQQSSHCIFLINEKEREKGGGGGGRERERKREKGVWVFSASLWQLCSYPTYMLISGERQTE